MCLCFYSFFFFFPVVDIYSYSVWSEKMLEMIPIFKLYHGLIYYLGCGLSFAYSMRT